jgi:hypothetical protein
MGTWGLKIFENDLYKDLEYDFFELYNNGLEVKSITEKLLEKYNLYLNSDEDSNDFWFCIADLQWQCKALDNSVLNKVKDIIESKSDLVLWKENGASASEVLRRDKILEAFLKKISSPPKSAKRRVKKKSYNSIHCCPVKI